MVILSAVLFPAISSRQTTGTGATTNNTNNFGVNAVGGILIDPSGLLESAKTDDLGVLSKRRRQRHAKSAPGA